MNVQIVQDTERQERDWWRWSVWLEGPDEELDRIDHVEYILHPTFREPIKQRRNRADNFRLNASGWGEFMLYAKIYAKDGSVERHEHWVTLRDAPARSFDAATDEAMSGEGPVPAEQLMVYLSFSVADAPIADDLMDELEARGVTVLTAEDIDPTGSRTKIASSVGEPQPEVDGAIVVISDARSSYVLERDMRRLRAEGITVVPVLIGGDAGLPTDMTDLPTIHLKDPGNIEEAAAGVVAHLQERAR